METTVQHAKPSTEPFPGDIVQIYAPKAMGRIGVVVGQKGRNLLVSVSGVGKVEVERSKALLVKKSTKDEVQWIRKRI